MMQQCLQEKYISSWTRELSRLMIFQKEMTVIWTAQISILTAMLAVRLLWKANRI